jgi:hypothetical protein
VEEKPIIKDVKKAEEPLVVTEKTKTENTLNKIPSAETVYIGSINDIESTDYGTINARALVRRRALALQEEGNPVDALLLLKTIGE